MPEDSSELEPGAVLLETNNPLDVTPEDLDGLADLLEAAEPGARVEIGYEDQYGSGVTGHEVLLFWIPNAEAIRDGLYVALITACLGWLRERSKRKPSEHRTKSLTVYDASTGKPIRRWILKDAESEPTEEQPEPMRRPIPKRRARGRHRR
jgi:hypothetical protein